MMNVPPCDIERVDGTTVGEAANVTGYVVGRGVAVGGGDVGVNDEVGDGVSLGDGDVGVAVGGNGVDVGTGNTMNKTCPTSNTFASVKTFI